MKANKTELESERDLQIGFTCHGNIEVLQESLGQGRRAHLPRELGLNSLLRQNRE